MTAWGRDSPGAQSGHARGKLMKSTSPLSYAAWGHFTACPFTNSLRHWEVNKKDQAVQPKIIPPPTPSKLLGFMGHNPEREPPPPSRAAAGVLEEPAKGHRAAAIRSDAGAHRGSNLGFIPSLLLRHLAGLTWAQPLALPQHVRGHKGEHSARGALWRFRVRNYLSGHHWRAVEAQNTLQHFMRNRRATSEVLTQGRTHWPTSGKIFDQHSSGVGGTGGVPRGHLTFSNKIFKKNKSLKE